MTFSDIVTSETTLAGDESRIAPMRRQFLQIKKRFPNTILLFRLGDFYETFEEDALVASSVLDIVLTGREMGKGVRAPMAGIPHHSAESYIARLVAAGYKVAICEQIGEAVKGRGLVERDVTRVITPGTVTDPSMLDARQNSYVVAVVEDGARVGLAYADISTGEFAATEFGSNDVSSAGSTIGRELLRLGAREVVVPHEGSGEIASPAWLLEGVTLSPVEAWTTRHDRAVDHLQGHFGVSALDGFGLVGQPLATRASSTLLRYLEETQRSGVAQVTDLRTYDVSGFMTLDAQTRRNLELTESSRGEKRHSLVAVLDQTRTPMGARLLRRWLSQPLVEPHAISARLDRVERWHAGPMERHGFRETLRAIGDIERLVNRAVTGAASPRELGQLRSSLATVPDAFAIAASVGESQVASPELHVAHEVHLLLEQALAEEPPPVLGKGTAIRSGFASDLDGHEARAREAREWIAGLERSERDRTGIKSLKVGYNKVFGYYLEISTVALAAAERERRDETVLPADYLPKQTLSNATRYFTPQLKEYETIVLTAQETLAAIEADVYRRVLAAVAERAPALLRIASDIAALDVVSTFAEIASTNAYTRPTIDESRVIEIVDGRHPTLEALLGPGEYVPNDALLDADSAQITILTGPNMAGKSSWLRQVSLIVLMAQIGCYVPARAATIGIVDRIFTRIGAQDDIASGQSTFMVEMLETAAILNHASPRSLLVLDEIGRGTSTNDGLAIAQAIVEHIHNAPNLGCRTLFATHYHELTGLAEILPRIRCSTMDVLEEGDRVVFLRKVIPGKADRSYGVNVAQIAGIPKAVVRRAREILEDLEQDGRSAEFPLPAPRGDAQAATFQLTMFGGSDPIVEELRTLDVAAMSPLEAITALFSLQAKARPAR